MSESPHLVFFPPFFRPLGYPAASRGLLRTISSRRRAQCPQRSPLSPPLGYHITSSSLSSSPASRLPVSGSFTIFFCLRFVQYPVLGTMLSQMSFFSSTLSVSANASASKSSLKPMVLSSGSGRIRLFSAICRPRVMSIQSKSSIKARITRVS